MSHLPETKLVKVALVTNMVAPYRVSFYNSLAEYCQLTVVVDTESEFNRTWDLDPSKFSFSHVVMNSASIVLPRIRKDLGYREHRQLHFSQSLLFELKRLRPDIVVSNELGLRSLWCLLYARVTGISWILASEATNHTEGWVGIIKRTFRKFLIAEADGFWSNGEETSRFLVDRGACRDTICADMTGIATYDFQQAANKALVDRDALRTSLGLAGVVFLFVGRLESGKGMVELMKAIQQRRNELAGRCSFLFVGAGSMREYVEAEARGIKGIPFHFQGFVQPERLPEYFVAGDVFVMPTLDDNWPLVNLEALAAGLPQIYSIFNGGALDLNHVAGIGSAIDPTDIDALGRRLVDCVQKPPSRIESDPAQACLEYYSPKSQGLRGIKSIFRSLGASIGD